jgi:DNA modification methylase
MPNADAELPSSLKVPSQKARLEALQLLARDKDIDLIPVFKYLLETDSSTLVRREAMSALGRLRQNSLKELFKEYLSNQDSKIALQALRALLPITTDSEISSLLEPLRDHESEVIRGAVDKILEKKNTSRKTKVNELNREPYYNLSIQGDALNTLKKLPDGLIHLTFTSPPYYNARDYSIYKSYEGYLKVLADIFKETHRATAEGRYLIVNTSPVIVPRFSRDHSSTRYPIPFDLHALLSKQGWEFIDDLVWLKPEASVKNRNGGFFQHRKPLAYKPNSVTEMLMVYRKKTNRLIDWNLKQYSSETIAASLVPDGYETSNVWKIDPRNDKVHSAVFPEALCERVIDYYSMVGDLVFDPFAGSGTLGRVALKRDRNFLMTEMDSTYFESLTDRLLKISSQIGARAVKFGRLEDLPKQK